MSRRSVLLTRPQRSQEPNLGVVQGVDVSRYQGDIRPWLETWTAWGIEHVVVQLQTVPSGYEALAIDQLQVAHAVGLTCGGYIWAHWEWEPAACVAASLDVARAAGVPLGTIWLDAEDPVPAGGAAVWLQDACRVVEAAGFRAGVYTGRYWWRDNTGDSDALSDHPLWVANYDGNPSLDSQPLFGSWPRELLAGKQWTSDPLDRDTFATWVTRP